MMRKASLFFIALLVFFSGVVGTDLGDRGGKGGIQAGGLVSFLARRGARRLNGVMRRDIQKVSEGLSEIESMSPTVYGGPSRFTLHFERIRLRIRPFLSFSLPGLVRLRIVPWVEFQWEKRPPNNWENYRPSN